MWDLPGPGLEHVSSALAGGFLTTAPPGKPPLFHLELIFVYGVSRGSDFTFFFFNKFIYFYLFILAVLGLRFCTRAFSSCGEWGPLFIAVRGPLTVVASLVVEHRLQMRRLSSCGSRTQLPCGMWDLPGPGLEPMSRALAGKLSTTAPPGKPPTSLFCFWISSCPSTICQKDCSSPIELYWHLS